MLVLVPGEHNKVMRDVVLIDGKLTYIQINEEIRNAVNLIPGTERAPYPHHLRSRSLPPGTPGTSGHTIDLSLIYICIYIYSYTK